MKNFIYLFSIFLVFSCAQTNEENAGTIKRTDDLSVKVMDLAKEYQQNSYELTRQIYSDTVQVSFNSVSSDGLANLIAGWEQQHEVFSDISMTDEYVHTNYFSDGNIWSNYWFTWKATSKSTGVTISNPVHSWFKWDGDKVSEGAFIFDPTEYVANMPQ